MNKQKYVYHCNFIRYASLSLPSLWDAFTIAERDITPRSEIDRSNNFPAVGDSPSDLLQVDAEGILIDLWENSVGMGLLGITVSSKYGGLEQGYFQHTLAMEELSRASGSVALSYGAHSNLCVNQIYRGALKSRRPDIYLIWFQERKLAVWLWASLERKRRYKYEAQGWQNLGRMEIKWQKFWYVTSIPQIHSNYHSAFRITNGPTASTLSYMRKPLWEGI